MKKLLLCLVMILMSSCVNLSLNLGGTINNVTIDKKNGNGEMNSTNDVSEENPSKTSLTIPITP